MTQDMEQWTNITKSMGDSLASMMTGFPLGVKPPMNMQGAWSLWLEAAQAGYEMNVTWWRTFMNQSEEMFFQALKESPMRTDALEQQMRELWASVKKAQQAQQDTIKEQLLKTEVGVKEKTPPTPALTVRPKAGK